MGRAVVAFLVSVTVTLSHSLGAAQSWPTAGHDLRNTRSQPNEITIDTTNASQLAKRWEFTTAGDVSATATVSNGAVYFPDWAGFLYAVGAGNGKLIWKHAISDYNGQPSAISLSSPAIYRDELILGDNVSQAIQHNGAHIMAVDRKSGRLIWITQVDPHPAAIITGSPVVSGATIYVGVSSNEKSLSTNNNYPCCTHRGSMVALNAQTGKILWQTYTVPDNGRQTGGYSGGEIMGTVAFGNGTLFTSTGNNHAVPASVAECESLGGTNCESPDDHFDSALALDPDTGSVKWAHTLLIPNKSTFACTTEGSNCSSRNSPDYDFSSGPNFLGNLVGFGQTSGIYWALDSSNGNVVWARSVGPGSTLAGIEGGTATDGSRIYVAVANNTHESYKLADGGPTISWGSWAALDAQTGDFIWQIADPTNGAIDPGSVTVSNGVVYAGSYSGYVYAIDAVSGSIIWNFHTGGSVIAGPSIAKGFVFWGSGFRQIAPGTGNNKVYAFAISESDPASQPSPASQIVGNLQTATGDLVSNGTLSFSLFQPAIVSSKPSIVANVGSCYTSAAGNIVGVPDPPAVPVFNTNTDNGNLPGGIYYIKIVYLGPSSTISMPSPEATAVLSSAGTITVNAPAMQPASATGFYGVYLGTSPGAETLQGTVTSWTNFVQSTPLVIGTALPTNNNTSCDIRLPYERGPSRNSYIVSLTNKKNGSLVAGHRQTWCTYGGADETINVLTGDSMRNCRINGGFYPTPIMANPDGQKLQSINGSLTVLGKIRATSGAFRAIDNIQYAGQFSGADPCAQISNAIAALPPTGGIVDARGFQGTLLACSGGFTIGSGSKPITLLLGAATFTINGQIVVNSTDSHIFGVTGSNILQGPSFPSNAALIEIGRSAVVESATVEHVSTDCDNVANSIGAKNTGGQELSGFFDFVSENCTKYGIWYEGTNAQNSFGRGWTILPSGGGATIGAYIHNVPAFRGVRDMTVNTNDGSTIGSGLTIDGTTGGAFDDLHFEHSTRGVDIGPTRQSVGIEVSNVIGNGSVPTLVKIENTLANRVQLRNLISNGSATLLNDALHSITDTNTLIKFYDTNDGSLAPFYIVGGQPLRLDGPLRLAETSAPRGAAGADICYGDSTAHAVKCSQNNGRFSVVPLVDLAQTWTGIQTGMRLVSPTINILTNGTGLQVFNTSTTCTTAASAGATCTTAPITLPVEEADTSYRVVCTGKGVKNVPVVVATTNFSTTQFTITIAALTPAAARFSSYDCVAGHN